MDGVLVPGEPEHRRRIARQRDGIPLAGALVAELDGLATAAGVPGLRD
jgi:LDH2 family malate/lactate/ureidoglycolate dehydrogenase